MLGLLAVGGCGSEATDTARATAARKAAASHLVVAVEPSAARLQPSTTVRGARRPRVKLVAARGESEGAQVELAASKRGSSVRVAAAVRGLDLPATVYEERPMTVRHASPGGARGTYLDPLLPMRDRTVRVRGNSTTVLWVDVAVPRDARVGTHRGTLELRMGRRAVRVPLSVAVGTTTLPLKPRLASSIGLDESQIDRFEQPPRDSAGRFAARDRYNRLLASARLAVGDIYTPALLGENPTAFARTADAARLAQVLDRPGVHGARVSMYATFPYHDPLGADRARTVTYLRNVAAYYRAHGWLAESYVYVIDEPGDSLAPRVAELGALVREADPALRLLVTHEPTGRFAAIGTVGIWAANVSRRVDVADINRTHAQHKQYWWYPSISTQTPYPTLFIDDLRPSPRMLGWLADRYGIDGFLYYSATHWHTVKNPWTEPGTWRNPDGSLGNGDGVLVYPGRPKGLSGPAPSVRLLQLRDGIEDDDLLAIARKRDGAAKVDALVNSLASSLTTWSSNPLAIDHAHARLVRGVK